MAERAEARRESVRRRYSEVRLGPEVRPAQISGLLEAIEAPILEIRERVRQGDERLLQMNSVEMSAHVTELLASVLGKWSEDGGPECRVYGDWKLICELIGDDANGNPIELCYVDWVPYVTQVSMPQGSGSAAS